MTTRLTSQKTHRIGFPVPHDDRAVDVGKGEPGEDGVKGECFDLESRGSGWRNTHTHTRVSRVVTLSLRRRALTLAAVGRRSAGSIGAAIAGARMEKKGNATEASALASLFLGCATTLDPRARVARARGRKQRGPCRKDVCKTFVMAPHLLSFFQLSIPAPPARLPSSSPRYDSATSRCGAATHRRPGTWRQGGSACYPFAAPIAVRPFAPIPLPLQIVIAGLDVAGAG